jgi:hypothetical protein
MKPILILVAAIAGVAPRPLFAQTCSGCAAPSFADTSVSVSVGLTAGRSVTPASTGAGEMRVNVQPISGFALPSGLPAGVYAAWCGASRADATAPGVYTATTRPVLDAVVWNRIHYLLNHKAGSVTDVQGAIWALLGTLPLSTLNSEAQMNAVAMYEDAIARGSSFVPAAGQRIGVMLLSTQPGVQHLILEMVQCGSIGDRVWSDTNGNGIADAGEAGLNGVTVQLLDAAGAVLTSTVTEPSPVDYPWLASGTNGWYRFTGYCPGPYQVRVDPAQPALGGAMPSTPTTVAITLALPGERAADFGFRGGAPPLHISCPQSWTQRGMYYDSPAQATGGAAPYSFTLTGTLPPGLSMDAAANIRGTLPNPVTPGEYAFTVLASAASLVPVSVDCSITIVPPVTVKCLGADAQAGTPYAGSLPAAGGTGQYTFGATKPDSFPPGLTLERATGKVAGTPAAPSSFAFTVAVDDRNGLAGGPGTAACTLTVAPPSSTPLSLSCGSPQATKNVLYTSTVSAAGGLAPYRYSIAGPLPPGLTFDPVTGILSGTPSQDGSFSFTLQVQDSAGAVATAGCGITVGRAFTLSCPRPAGYAGLTYGSNIGVAGGMGPFSIIATGMPTGIALDAASLAGAPAVAGAYSIAVRVADGATGAWDTALCPLQIYTQPSLGCPAASGLPASLTASGGAGRYSFAGTLPAGWTLDPRSGVLAAAAPTPGLSNFTATVTDDAGSATATAQAVCSIRIAEPLVATCPSTAGQAGAPYSSAVTATGGIGSYTYSGTVPAGLSLTASGTLTGTSAVPGTFPMTFQASDSAGRTATIACTLVIAAAPPVVTCPSATGQATIAYSSKVGATGGVAPYTFSISSGTLPAGLNLEPATGAISGVPTTPEATFLVRVVDSRGTVAGTSTTSCVIQAAPAPLTLSGPARTAQAGVEYSSALVATGGLGPYTFAVAAGSLAPGLTVNLVSGAILGIPNAPGIYRFTAKVTDLSGQMTVLNAEIAVSAPPNSCGLSWGYWKNHRSAWPATSLTLGTQTYGFAELGALLDAPPRDDASLELVHQLIGARLNILNGTNQLTANAAVAAADGLLAAYPGKLPYGVPASSTVGARMNAVADALDFFNRDGAAQPGCVVRK